MEENQTNQNLNQQPVQPNQVAQQQAAQQQAEIQAQQQAQQQEQQVQQWQPVQQQQVQPQQNANQASVSMQIQQLLVQQQQYQKQYNELVDYVKKTPGLTIEQVNQIKAQLDQLNALFVEWKQKLQALWYTQVQVNKPTEVKKWAKVNLSFKKLAIWCGLVLVLLLAGLFAALFSLQNNPSALVSFGISTNTAKSLLQWFFALLFWGVIVLMLGVIVSNIYRLVTVKNQSKGRFVWWLIWWIFGVIIMWTWLWLVLLQINKIVPPVQQKLSSLAQPYLMWLFDEEWNRSRYVYAKDGQHQYPLIAPAEIWFDAIGSDIKSKLWDNTTIENVVLICGNNQWQRLGITQDSLAVVKDWGFWSFEWACLYAEKWEYSYALEVTYNNNISNEKNLKMTIPVTDKTLNFEAEIVISQNNNRIYPTNWEFNLWQAPAKISVDSNQIFSEFKLGTYNVVWDMDGDKNTDRENMVTFDYSYREPKVYYASVKFPDLVNYIYSFPVRIIPSDRPVCYFDLKSDWKTRYEINTKFVDPADAAKISSYNYTIRNVWNNAVLEVLKDAPQDINYTFPEQWNYVVHLDYILIDGRAWQCESDTIQMKKERFNVSYTMLGKDPETSRYKELCDSQSASYSNCKLIELDKVPETYQLQIRSVTPSTNTTKKAVFLNDKPILNDNDRYAIDIPDEWTYILTIVTSDEVRWMDEETIEIKFVADKPDIVGKMTITSADTRKPISDWFEPLSVILDASKTEVNVPWDEIVYFTWDFWDWEIKRNQQNWVVAHTYNFDYDRENWIFTPIVTVTTLKWITEEVKWPTLNVKKWLINVKIESYSHPTRQAPVWTEVSFSSEFDWLPEKMTWDFGDWSPTTTCKWRNCTEVKHTYKEPWVYSIKLNLEFDAVQEVDGTMEFKAY